MRTALRVIIVIMLVVFGSDCVCGQTYRVSVGFYNVENLFDTVPNPRRHDDEFTPSGSRHWTSGRYDTKLRNLKRVIDDAGFDILGLAEIENEAVLRDLVACLGDDYNYIHRSSNDYRGIDVAFIYKGDKYFPDAVEMIGSGTGRDFLYIRGRIATVPVGFVVCHLPSKLNGSSKRRVAVGRLAHVIDSLACAADDRRLVVMGDFNGDFREPVMRKTFAPSADGFLLGHKFYNALADCSRNGYGSYRYKGIWYMVDNIVVSESLTRSGPIHLYSAGVFIKRYMIVTSGSIGRKHYGYPYRTFMSGNYTGGYSDHLPVYIVLELCD